MSNTIFGNSYDERSVQVWRDYWGRTSIPRDTRLADESQNSIVICAPPQTKLPLCTRICNALSKAWEWIKSIFCCCASKDSAEPALSSQLIQARQNPAWGIPCNEMDYLDSIDDND